MFRNPKKRCATTLITSLVIAFPLLSLAQSRPLFPSSSPSEPPLPVPACKGDLRYKPISPGQKATIDGLNLTTDLVSCLTNRFDWCVGSWKIQLEGSKQKCDLEKDFLTKNCQIDIDSLKKVNDLSLAEISNLKTELESARAWYRNPWLWGSIGFVVGAAATGAVVYVLTR